MEVISISQETDMQRRMFFGVLFGDHEGYLCIAYADKARKNFREEFFRYPQEVGRALELVNRIYIGHEVWVCPQLFRTKARKKEHVSLTLNSWADLDTCQPESLLVGPTALVESSPGRYQAYWVYDKPIDADDAENISQRIAYKHADEGADRSGWDLTQLLRMPHTYNYKYASTPVVRLLNANRRRYRPKDFEDHYPQVAGYEYLEIPMPQEVPDGEELLQEKRLQLNPMIWRLYNQDRLEAGQEGWSETLWRLEMLLFEAGFTPVEVYAIANNAKCNKFERRGMSETLLWKDVCRAHSKHQQNTFALAPKPDKEQPLITDEERELIDRSGDTFIERYITWAKSLGDAAPQYHQAGAFIALSTLLAGSVQLPTSFGTVAPNLWFMILADTTLTRKSTAMDIAMDLVVEIDDEAIMATDGSLEGLMTTLATRPSKPSVFLRDEFSGLLEQMTKKDYMAGMPETLTKLYDGKLQKRILRKEVIEVRDPCLLIFAGGIKNKVTQLLTFEQVSSGFMPRFVFITAESDITRVKPLGPPTSQIDNNREAIRNELADIAAFYKATTTMEIKNVKVSYTVQKKWDAELTPQAWHRYNQIETQLLDAGVSSERPDIMTPVNDRLAKSILKAAILLSASRQKEEKVVVEELDIIRAAGYGENWRMYVREVMENIGIGQAEKQVNQVHNYIIKNPGVSRSQIMRTYHLNARDISQLLETLDQRSLITRQKQGRGETLWPTVMPSAKQLNFTAAEKGHDE